MVHVIVITIVFAMRDTLGCTVIPVSSSYDISIILFVYNEITMSENNILTILIYFIIIAIQGCTNCVHGSCDSNNNCVCNAGYTGLYCDTRKFKL